MKDFLSSLSDYDIRYTEESDKASLEKWLLDEQLQAYFCQGTVEERQILVNNWIGYGRYRCGITANYKKEIVGLGVIFMFPYQKVSIHGQCLIVVDPNLHKRGIEESLVRNLIHLGKQFGHLERLHSELIGNSPYRAAYLNEGFKTLFVQDAFVKDEGAYLKREMVEINLR